MQETLYFLGKNQAGSTVQNTDERCLSSSEQVEIEDLKEKDFFFFFSQTLPLKGFSQY